MFRFVFFLGGEGAMDAGSSDNLLVSLLLKNPTNNCVGVAECYIALDYKMHRFSIAVAALLSTTITEQE